MQTYQINSTNKKKLRNSLLRGAICRIDNLKLEIDDENGNSKKVKIKDFYPHIKFDSIKYAVVLNHSCSLSREHKVICTAPYLNIGFLEPIEKFLNKTFSLDFEGSLVKFEKDHHLENNKPKVCLYNKDEFQKKIKKKLEMIFQNNNDWNFFIAIGKKNPDLFLVNLLKTVPIKSNHYNEIFKKVRYQLHEEFADAIGWKIAELYGKVGTTDYTLEETSRLVDKTIDVINKKILKDFVVFPTTTETLSEAKKIISGKTEKVVEFLTSHGLIEAQIK